MNAPEFHASDAAPERRITRREVVALAATAAVAGFAGAPKIALRRKAALLCLTVAVSACDRSDPAITPDLQARWTADSLALRDGDAVSIWPDSSLNGRNAIATANNRPTYRNVDGVPTVQFDGIDDYLTAAAAPDWRFLKDGSEWTVFVVFRSAPGEPGAQHVLLDTDGEGSGFTVSYADRANAHSGHAVRLSIADATGALAVDLTTGNRGFPSGRWGIISATFKALPEGGVGQATLHVNGYGRAVTDTPLRPDRSRAATRLTIGQQGLGNAFPTKGEIREVAIYSRALPPDEHYQVIQQLAGTVSPAVRIRTPLTRTWLNYDPESYQGLGIAFRIPSTGKLVAIQRQALSHWGGSIGEVRQWESTDRGATWTSQLTYDSEYDDRNVAGGLASRTGSILAFVARFNGSYFVDMRALRSVDNAQTFSDIGTPLPTNGCWGFSPYGPMMELPSGRLLQTFYGGIPIGGAILHKAWISESVDDGLTWTHKADIYVGPLRVYEPSVAWVSGSDDATSTLVAVARNDGGSGLLQFVSHDGGNTWTSQGLIPGGYSTDVSPWLYRLSDGTLVNAWHERSSFTFRMRMGLAGDVAASPANWGPTQATYQALARVVGDSGYPALLSATGWDDDLIQVLYDASGSGRANLLISPISLP